MKKVNSLKNLSILSARAESPVRSSLRSPGHSPVRSPVDIGTFRRSKSVTSAPSLAKAAVEGARAQVSTTELSSKAQNEDAKRHTANDNAGGENQVPCLSPSANSQQQLLRWTNY
jgi:hypothetical protein